MFDVWKSIKPTNNNNNNSHILYVCTFLKWWFRWWLGETKRLPKTELNWIPIYQVETIKQTFCRALALILWPIFLYMVFFFIHLSVLNRSGNGDGFYSSAFQSRLIGNSLYNVSMPREVAYGAVVTIKNHKTGGGYLHSHNHLYPKNAGARQQQVS